MRNVVSRGPLSALAALTLCLPALAQAPAPAAPAGVDPTTFPAVVATVNGTSISKDDLVKALNAFTRRPGQPPPAANALPKEMYQQMLDQLINLRLLLDDAAKKGLTATAPEVQAEIDGMVARFESPAKLDEALAKEGMNRELLTREIGESITVRKLIDREIASKIGVSEADTKAYYDQNPRAFERREQFRVAHVLVKVEKEATAEQKTAARKKADELLVKLKGGADFAALAKESSDDPGSKANGGELPWLGAGDTVPPFEQAAMAVKAGQLTEVVESPFGFHIIKGIDHQAAGTMPYDQVKDRIGQVLKNQKTQQAVVAYATALRPTAKIEVKL